ncbi:hypothetical protein MNB_SM-4-911 [hydrothermal vent metagenome]|uniref:Desulfoferrodoxin ferrous iron-binding domain-containing protein n=1 Tax=hydrothermal vent metagenome TaxID=652676 RepID=A0A1W1CVT5_9ZZZZ
MKRREAIKLTALATLGMAVTAQACPSKNSCSTDQITVGQAGIIHPSVNGHWIDFISLYVDKKLVGKTILMAEISRGAAAFRVKLDGASFITANAGCNIHGIWVSTLTL